MWAGHHIDGMPTYFRAPYIQSAASGTLADTEMNEGTDNVSSQALTRAPLIIHPSHKWFYYPFLDEKDGNQSLAQNLEVGKW